MAIRKKISTRDIPPGFYLAAVGLLVMLWQPLLLRAQRVRPNEYQVKAVYLYNFGKFVEWPSAITARKAESFAVCVLGEDPFGPALDAALSNEVIRGVPMTAKRYLKPQDIGNCRVLF